MLCYVIGLISKDSPGGLDEEKKMGEKKATRNRSLILRSIFLAPADLVGYGSAFPSPICRCIHGKWVPNLTRIRRNHSTIWLLHDRLTFTCRSKKKNQNKRRYSQAHDPLNTMTQWRREERMKRPRAESANVPWTNWLHPVDFMQ